MLIMINGDKKSDNVRIIRIILDSLDSRKIVLFEYGKPLLSVETCL